MLFRSRRGREAADARDRPQVERHHRHRYAPLSVPRPRELTERFDCAAGASAPAKFDKEMPVFGLFGILTLLKCPYRLPQCTGRSLTRLVAHSGLPRRHHEALAGRTRARDAHLCRDGLLRVPDRPLEHGIATWPPGRGVPARTHQGAPLLSPLLLHLRRLRCHEPPPGSGDSWKGTVGVGTSSGTRPER